jgi:L-ascorbate metabolism protein UlaG (beta-lactamase superfamily)
MKVKWLGHASMLLTSTGGLRIITDPYETGAFGLGYAPIKEKADIVTISHDHGDHNNASSVKGKPSVVKTGGIYKVRGVELYGIGCYHDNSSGKERGKNIIFCFSLDGIRVCHLGDLGHALSLQDQSRIGPVDLLFIPVGGNFTIDAKVAAEVCRALKPRVAIPMHFCNGRCPNFPVARVDDFLVLMKNVEHENASEIELHKESLPEEMKVVVLEPAL